ncbi:hypothetical protein [Halobiforma nitratireducens]|uniref:Uncharacterized protein n=1 Tax=Halobiforma nitratireducens JCM 10879 TaxID=1227454 RepID=M0MIN8_9EURY|nr:hypothetical protein [Halobiforma nitratireducens]EMA45228.1 hypothetical protein C446_02442 [Halobiforma nitratireducens JCM 10879]
MTRTHYTHATRIAVVAMLVVSLFAAAGAGVATAETDTTIDGADLVVEQPSYVDDDVEHRSDGGTPVYIVDGEEHALYPQNFDSANVTGFGIDSGAGSLAADDDLERYVLDPEGETGSFELYWTVDREETVADGNETTTETETTRYEAVVRVDDQATVVVSTPAEQQQLEEDAQEWRDWNATVTEVREAGVLGHAVFGAPASNEEVMQTMVNRYLTLESPLHLLDGGLTAMAILGFTTLGGIAFILFLKFPDAIIIRRIYKELHKRRQREEAEGDLAARQEAEDLQNRLEKFANMDHQDIPPITDHFARGIRNDVGAETPAEFFNLLLHTIPPARLKESRVRAMGQSGYVAQVETDADGDVATDGGEPAIVDATLVEADAVLEPDESVRDRDDLREITDPSETLLAAIDLTDDALLEFPLENPAEAPFDLDAFDEPPAELSLPDLVDEFGFDELTVAEDELEHAGRMLVELLTVVRNHRLTDDEGRIKPVRYELENLFQFMQFADDVADVPLANEYRQMFERALEEYDRDDELETFLETHRQHTEGS